MVGRGSEAFQQILPCTKLVSTAPPMLQRTLRASITHHVPAHSPSAPQCIVCTCHCGALFRQPSSSQQTRSKAYARSAPSTYRKKRREESHVLTPDQARRRRQEAEEDRTWHFNALKRAKLAGVTQINEASAVDFLNEFDAKSRVKRGSNVVDPDWMREKVQEYGFTETDCLLVAFLLVRSNEDDRALGKKLLYSLSAIGNEEATIRIMSHALLGAKDMPNLIKSSEIVYTRGHLREIARKGESYRAMVLEGKIACLLGDEEYGIRMWDQAMAAAVENSERIDWLRTQGKIGELRALEASSQRDLSELSSPWIELTLIHYERYARLYNRNEITAALAELEKSRAAMEIGCQQDDPTSHYHAAAFFREVNEDGSTKHTSTWLYHMTKAAASGHVKACTALAEFYARSGWKYIEDEPPDHIKPTPFDSYPRPGMIATATSSLKRILGLAEALPVSDTSISPSQAAREEIFHTAIFPSTPIDRWKMAMRWLDPALLTMYAPAYLLAAKMLLEKTLWSQAQAPKAALTMTANRYDYASKEDYEASRTIKPPAPENATEPPDPLNPGYDPSRAKDFLTEVFYAANTHRRRQAMLKVTREAIRKRKVSGMVDEEMVDDPGLQRDLPAFLHKWMYASPDVRELYEGEVEDLEREAKGICESEGWDLYDSEGGLVYKSGVGNGSKPAESVNYALGVRV